MRRHRCEPGKPNGIQWDFFGTYVRNPFWWDPPYPEFIRWKKPLWAFWSQWETVETTERPPIDFFSLWRTYTWSVPAFRYPRRAQRLPAHLLNFASTLPTERDVDGWRKKYWKKRTPYVRPGRKPWALGWRTERKMRDLTAHLKIENDGWDTSGRSDAIVPPRYNVKRMQEITTQRAHEAWIEERFNSGPAWPQRPARHTTERRYLYPAPGPSLRRLYKPIAANGRRCGPSAASLLLPLPDRNPAPWCRI
jgi:hypothetical protein